MAKVILYFTNKNQIIKPNNQTIFKFSLEKLCINQNWKRI